MIDIAKLRKLRPYALSNAAADELARLQEAKRKWCLIADERSKENCALRQLLRDARDDVRPDVLARIDAALLEQN